MLPDGIDVFCHRLLMELGAVRSNGPLIGVQGHLAVDNQLPALGQTHDKVGAPGLAGIVREAVLGGVVITLDKTTDLQGSLQLRLTPGTSLLGIALKRRGQVARLLTDFQSHILNAGDGLMQGTVAFGRCIMNFIHTALEPGNLFFQRCQHAIQAGLACFSELLALLLENPVGQIFELLLQGVAGFFDEILLFGDDLLLLLVPCREPGDLLSQFFSRPAQPLPLCLGVIQRLLQGLGTGLLGAQLGLQPGGSKQVAHSRQQQPPHNQARYQPITHRHLRPFTGSKPGSSCFNSRMAWTTLPACGSWTL